MRARLMVPLLGLACSAVAHGQLPQRTDTVRRHSGLAGTVRDSLQHPIVLAGIIVEGEDATTVTDTSGHFYIGGLATGVHTITIRHVGYEAISFEATLPADSTVLVAVHLHKVQDLDAVVVTSTRSAHLARTGYFERQKQGLGTFLSPEHIDSMTAVDKPSAFLRTVRGIDIRCVRDHCAVLPHLAPCLWLFVDGVQYRDIEIDDLLTTSAVYAIEVYDHPSTVPLEFQGRLPTKTTRGMSAAAAGGCAAVVVWTRSKAAP